ncbi:MAG TPA: ribonuclease P protein component [Chryseosolibacter sp.]
MRFVKKERLNNEILIKELFERGSSFYLFPFKVHFMNNPDPDFPFHQVLFSVSKRNFKRAVDRNLLKRRMREAFRLNKESLPASRKLLIAYIYTAKEILTFTQIQERLVKTLNRFDHVEKV